MPLGESPPLLLDPPLLPSPTSILPHSAIPCSTLEFGHPSHVSGGGLGQRRNNSGPPTQELRGSSKVRRRHALPEGDLLGERGLMRGISLALVGADRTRGRGAGPGPKSSTWPAPPPPSLFFFRRSSPIRAQLFIKPLSLAPLGPLVVPTWCTFLVPNQVYPKMFLLAGFPCPCDLLPLCMPRLSALTSSCRAVPGQRRGKGYAAPSPCAPPFAPRASALMPHALLRENSGDLRGAGTTSIDAKHLTGTSPVSFPVQESSLPRGPSAQREAREEGRASALLDEAGRGRTVDSHGSALAARVHRVERHGEPAWEQAGGR